MALRGEYQSAITYLFELEHCPHNVIKVGGWEGFGKEGMGISHVQQLHLQHDGGQRGKLKKKANSITQIDYRIRVIVAWIKKDKTYMVICTVSYQHLRDHVVWDFILPELSGNKTVTVALRHSTCSTWQREEISVQILALFRSSCVLQVLYLDAGCSWFWTPRWDAETDNLYLGHRPSDGPDRSQSLWLTKKRIKTE